MELKKALKKIIIFCILAPICLVAGIPAIVLGAVFKLVPILVMGIVMVVFGFYGTPLLLIKFSKYQELNSLYLIITRDKVYAFSEISSMLGKPVQYIRGNVITLIEKQYLVGYKIDNNQAVVPIEIQDDKPKVINIKCPNCGANISKTEKVIKCRYCGSQLLSENIVDNN